MPVTTITNVRGENYEKENLEGRLNRLGIEDVELGYFNPNYGLNDGYRQHARTLFDFFRRAGDGRYSSQTLMRFMHAYEATEAGRTDQPSMYTVSTPFAFDEKTEVKSGGMLAACASVPYEQTSRLLIAVTPAARRKGLASIFSSWFRANINASPITFIHASNIDGQRFALADGWEPFSVAGNGVVKYILAGERRAARRREESGERDW